MKGDVATRKELYAIVVLSFGITVFKGFLGRHDEGIDGVGSIHGETKLATLVRYGLEIFLSDDINLEGRARCILS